jgi:hypothetical protein
MAQLRLVVRSFFTEEALYERHSEYPVDAPIFIYANVISGHMPTLGLECVDPLAGLAEMAPTRV